MWFVLMLVTDKMWWCEMGERDVSCLSFLEVLIPMSENGGEIGRIFYVLLTWLGG